MVQLLIGDVPGSQMSEQCVNHLKRRFMIKTL